MAALDWLQQILGGEADQGAPMAVQNRQGGFDPYQPAAAPDALSLLYEMAGGKDLSQAYQAYQRGEYLPAFGQGTWGAAQAATMAAPALRAGGAALRVGAPLAREAAAAIPAMMADETGAIRAYHGSPHSFDKFDLGKIGIGEGAQSYGHGLYFAEAEPTALAYRDTLTPRPAGLSDPGYDVAQYWLKEAGGNRDAAVKAYLEYVGPHADDAVAAYLRKPPGHMYEVDIHADPKAFLDWDRPLAGQSASVRDAVNRVGRDPRFDPGRITDEMRGLDLHQLLQNPEAVAALAQRGVPGIRYLDQGSRGAGMGTSNYVVGDDKIIEILRKYGILPPIVAGGGLLATGQEPPT